MKIDKEEMLKRIHEACGNFFINHDNKEQIIIDAIESFLEKEEVSVSDTSLAIAIVTHYHGGEEIPPLKTVRTAIGFIDKRIKELAVENFVVPGMVNGKLGQLVFPIAVYAKAQWIEMILRANIKEVAK